MSEIEITQADREAAAEVFGWFNPEIENAGEGVKAGQYDENFVVQTLARHRTQARAEAIEEARPYIEALADDVESYVQDQYGCGDGYPHPALEHKFNRDMEPVNEARAFLRTLSATP